MTIGGGWLKLEYDYSPSGELDYTGITFSCPENLVAGATLMANGPYHVWKNRLRGTQFGISFSTCSLPKPQSFQLNRLMYGEK
ncbi:MAG: hypothetical protein MUC93_04790 [Bacteroidales bacterium]|nr:hypothetical protein [Bacteroidales bacterium]